MEKEAETGVMQKGLASTASMPEAPGRPGPGSARDTSERARLC